MSNAIEHVKKLTSLGPRALGSKANLKAAEYIKGAFVSAGLMIEEQEFDCPNWECKSVTLKQGSRKLPVTANDFSRPCDLTAPFLPLCTREELEAADLDGKVALLYGALSHDSGYSNRKAFYCPEEDKRLLETLEAKKPLAVVLVNLKPANLVRMMCDWEFPIPTVSVPSEAGLRLLKNPDQPVSLKLESKRSAGKARNIVGFKQGRRQERIVLMAHFDTYPNTVGASDNAGGAGILLALAEKFANSKLEQGLEFYAVNGEEVGGVGDVEYLKRHANVLPKVLAAINMDGLGDRLASVSITVMGAAGELAALVEETRKGFPAVVHIDPWYASDHTALLSHGVPCIPITDSGIQNNHSPLDNMDWISPEKLDETVALVTEIVNRLQDKTPERCRPAANPGGVA
jgi:aminopeptidase YwaD